jgi:hypothetical protein
VLLEDLDRRAGIRVVVLQPFDNQRYIFVGMFIFMAVSGYLSWAART